jgi:choice-of-anchor C domain-containing protein
MRRTISFGIMLVLLLACVGAVSAATVLNGGFEAPGTFIGDYQTFATLQDWSVDAGSVDLINGYWEPHSGSYSIDLAGNSPGTISQTIDTKNGETCELTFWMAGNPDNGGGDRSVHVFWGENNEVFGSPFTFTPQTKASMGWVQNSVSGLAASGPTKIIFVADPTSAAWGPALDDISVVCNGGTTPIPEFPGIALPVALIVGLIGAVLFIQKSKEQ